MNELTVPPPRKLWVRLLLMVLLAAAFQLAASVLLFLAVVQLVLVQTQGYSFLAAAWAATWARLPRLKALPPRPCPSRSANGQNRKKSPEFRHQINL
jgi:hypothetical protein